MLYIRIIMALYVYRYLLLVSWQVMFVVLLYLVLLFVQKSQCIAPVYMVVALECYNNIYISKIQ